MLVAPACSSSDVAPARDAGSSSGGSVGSGGNGGAGGAGGASSGSGGANAGGSGGAGGVGTAGSGGSVTDAGGGSGGADVRADAPPPAPDTGLPDPGTEGDGNRMIGPTYTRSPLVDSQANVPKGRRFNFSMNGTASQIYKGVTGNYTRAVNVYIPPGYVAGTPAPLIVTNDAMGQDVLPNALDNLIAMRKMPKIVVFFVGSGGGDSIGSQRGLEYDTVSGLFAEFINKEVLPRGIAEAQTQLNLDLKLTDNPEGRGTMGGSSGGAAAFSMAWWHPDLFRRVIAFSGTFVSQVAPNTPFPHGCWIYHDVDPRFTNITEPARGLIVQHCQKTGEVGVSNPGPCDTPLTQTACEAVAGCSWNTNVNKPIRVWIQSSDRDFGVPGNELDPRHGPREYRDFHLANQRMAMALKARGYHYHYDFSLGAGHVDGRVIGQTLPEALQWAWRGYPID